ncbi:hypothetical protein B0H67DRAFT_169832 [Lasiosphaeris hirsuta]|uniref:Uncharacterized protein n=1 Tax=Lasiosphaeris hirsuta TaxID=260670 RepID=A0AA40AQ56_9PEZI|nr:hypothetical protein B0H67DRAFT_169832 [Lasiosphaeris hirsuta]
MPVKSRDYYTVEARSGRDFFWFSPGGSIASHPPREEAEMSPAQSKSTRRPASRQGTSKSRSSSVPRSAPSKQSMLARKALSTFSGRRIKMIPIAEETIDTLMTSAIVPRESREPTEPKPGPWSRWHECNDQKRLWRARQLPNESWDYQFKRKNTPAPQKKTVAAGRPISATRNLASFFFGIPLPAPVVSPPSSQASPKPTITITPPPPNEDESTSTTNSESTGRRGPKISGERSSATTFPSTLSTGKGKGSSLSIHSSGQASREGREGDKLAHGPQPNKPNNGQLNPKSPAKAGGPRGGSQFLSPNARSTAGTGKMRKKMPKPIPAITVISLSKPPPRRQAPAKAAAAVGTTPNNNSNNSFNNISNSKKLGTKVRSEKELRIDTKKRVRGWLKDVEPETAPQVLDQHGLLIYR